MTVSSHARYRSYLETLTPGALAQLGEYVRDDVRFRDPFNDVSGVDAMRDVFIHMFENLGPVRFTVSELVSDGDLCMLVWRFDARLSGKPWSFEGTSVVRFAADGRVASHIDHWDSAGAFYERLPVIGWLLARIRRSIGVRHHS